MKQKHYTFLTVFIVIAFLIMTTAAWREYVHATIIGTAPFSLQR